MEDWKTTQQDDAEASNSLGPDRSKPWNPSETHLSSFHDPSEHWKPTSADNDTHGHDLNKRHSRRPSLDEPIEDKTYIRHLSAHDPAATTLIERETCADHVIKVWNEISKVIVEKLKEGYGVKIAGLGTFTYCLERIPGSPRSGGKCERMKKIPIMILSEFVVRMYRLITPLQDWLSDVPTVPLNLTPVIANTRLPQKIVDGVMTEVLQAFARAVVCGKNIEFPFPNIGKLQIVDRKVIFKFYAEFCYQLDFASEAQEADALTADPFILPGTMTPLRRHIPTADFRSVFHLREVRSVHQFDLLAPVKQRADGEYIATSGMEVKIPTRSQFKAGGSTSKSKPGSRSRSASRSKSSASFSTSFRTRPVHIIVEDRDNYRNNLKQWEQSGTGDVPGPELGPGGNYLFGRSLLKRYTISWVKGKRNYKNKDKDPWPGHHYHVVESAAALRNENTNRRQSEQRKYTDNGTDNPTVSSFSGSRKNSQNKKSSNNEISGDKPKINSALDLDVSMTIDYK